jgi:PAS domain S-box-containing protein
MCGILGSTAEEMHGGRILDFIHESDRNGIDHLLQHGIGSTACSFEVRLTSKTGRQVWAFFKTARIVEQTGEYKGLLAMVTDVTETKRAEEELKRLSLIARSTTNAIIISNPAGQIEWVNEAFTNITGFSFEEIAGKTRDVLYGGDTNAETVAFMEERLLRREPFECELLKYKRSGTPFWVQIQGRPVFHNDGRLNYYFQMETDITERKHAYAKLMKTENQIRTFARQLNHILEDERSRIAREIHDEFGQQLMGLKMSLSSLDRMNGVPAEAASIIRDLLSGVESTFQSMRHFATELRPGILDTLGLVPSIEWLGQGFEKRSGISCNVRINVREQMFEKDVSTNYFRICQEALTNIMKHAQATRVSIGIDQDAETLTMEISDNGKGILTENLENPFSLGLLGMRERARLIGGNLKIDSDPRLGTRIQLSAKIYGH